MVEVIPEGPGKGKLRYNLHAGQRRVMASAKRFLLLLAGTQSGKTVTGPPWLLNEIRRRGPGDYLVVSPSYPLLSKKALPEFQRLFERQLRLGKYQGQQKIFTFSEEGERRVHGRAGEEQTRVYFAHAQDPESLESATAKGCWCDEAGQKKFRLGSWEAILRRVSVHQGRVLVTTTPYDLSWLKQQLYDPWAAAGGDHPDIDVVNFTSLMNPAFPREEYEKARLRLPAWKFALFYEARFTRPAGLIYDCFDPRPEAQGGHLVKRRRLPAHWKRHIGIDFGPVNTAAVCLAEEEDDAGNRTGRLVLYREYWPGRTTERKNPPEQHVKALLAGEPRPPSAVGGAPSEDEWRESFADAGLAVRRPPVSDVEVGIDCVYAAIKRNELLVTEDCTQTLDQLGSYSREVDEAGVVGEKIEAKETYHLLDALRYVLSELRTPGPTLEVRQVKLAEENTVSQAVIKYPEIRHFAPHGTFQATPILGKVNGEGGEKVYGPEYRTQAEAACASECFHRLLGYPEIDLGVSLPDARVREIEADVRKFIAARKMQPNPLLTPPAAREEERPAQPQHAKRK